MNQPAFEPVTACMLLGLAAGQLFHLFTSQMFFLAVGLGVGCLLGFVLERGESQVSLFDE